LILSRRRDRLVLVGGTGAAIVGLHLVAGSNVLEGTYRYGVVLIMPVVLSVSCLLREVLTELDGGRVVRSRAAMALVVGWALVMAAERNWFDRRTRGSLESTWTLRSELDDAHERALALIVGDARRNGRDPSRVAIVAQHHWDEYPLRFYAPGPGGPRVLSSFEPGLDLDGLRRRLVEHLESGSYAVCYPRQYADFPPGHVEAMLQGSIAPERLHRWELSRQGKPWLVVYRLRNAGDPAAARIAEPVATGGRPTIAR
jgi:hypothetical protein